MEPGLSLEELPPSGRAAVLAAALLPPEDAEAVLAAIPGWGDLAGAWRRTRQQAGSAFDVLVVQAMAELLREEGARSCAAALPALEGWLRSEPAGVTAAVRRASGLASVGPAPDFVAAGAVECLRRRLLERGGE
jgi:hypothetical protein